MLASPAQAQSSEQWRFEGEVSCELVQFQVIDENIRDLLGQAQYAQTSGDLTQAIDRLNSAIAAIQTLPRAEDKTIAIGSLLVISHTNNDPLTLLEIFQVALSTQEESLRFQQTLAQAGTVIASLDVGYSSRKAEAWVRLASLYRSLEQIDLATTALIQAQSAATTIADPAIQANALIDIAEGYLALEQTASVGSLLQQAQMLTAEIEQDTHKQTVLAALAVAYAHLGESDQAISLTQSISPDNYRHSFTLQQIVGADLDRGNLDTALETASLIPKTPYRAIALSQVGLAQWQGGQRESAIALFEQAVALAQTTENPDYDLAQVLEIYGQAQPGETAAIAQTLQNPDQKIKVLSQLALQYHHQGDAAAVTSLTAMVLETLQEIPQDWQWFLVQEQLVKNSLAAGAYDQAITYVDGLANSTSYYDLAVALNDIAQQAVKTGNFDTAIQAAVAIPAGRWDEQTEALTAIISGYLEQGQTAPALQLIESFSEESVVIGASVYLVQQLYATDRVDETNGLLAAVQNRVALLSEPDMKMQAQVDLLTVPLSTEMKASLWTELETTLQQIADTWSRDAALVRATDRMVKAEHYSLAAELAWLMSVDFEQQQKISEILEAAIAAEEYDTAQVLLQQSTLPAQQTHWLLNLSDRYRQQNQLPQATALLEQAEAFALTIPDPESRQIILGREGHTIVEDDRDRASQLEAIALRYAQMGQPTIATATLDHIEDTDLREYLKQKVGCW
ncbi:MAG: hypothetical protein F6K42_06145 [Leptolyngbya sp. SIO1D8]|nr:hypothetical protein [Leptolyngbya sp. SIO1D8]